MTLQAGDAPSPRTTRHGRAVRSGLLALGLACCAAEASAVPMPAEIADALVRVGPVINLADTAALYAPALAARGADGIRTALDQGYGPDPRQRLDVFTTAEAGALRPVLVFVHGGGFTGGDKRGPDGSPFYANVGQWAARNGLVGVNMTYRLAPAHPYPAVQTDIDLALAWVRANVAAYGGDPDRVVLMGHSAGASHVAGYVAQGATTGLTGAVLLSGLYELADASESARAYYGDDPALLAARAPGAGLERVGLNLLIGYAELDPPEFAQQARRLHDRLTAVGRAPGLVVLAGHNHMSEIYSIGTDDTSASDPLLSFVAAR